MVSRQRGSLRGHESPVLLILRALLDPGLDLGLIGRREREVGFRRRHHLVFVGRKNAFPDDALLQVACDDGRPILVLPSSVIGEVQAELGFAGFLVGAVATEAVLGQDRSDVPVEPDVLSLDAHRGVQA